MYEKSVVNSAVLMAFANLMECRATEHLESVPRGPPSVPGSVGDQKPICGLLLAVAMVLAGDIRIVDDGFADSVALLFAFNGT